MRSLSGVGAAGVLAAAVVAATPGRTGATQTGSDRTTQEFRFLMGTSMQVRAVGATPDERRAAIDEAFGAMAEVDRLMSNYRDDSELSHVNRDASAGAVPVSGPMFSILDAAERVSRRSDGAFDVTVGPLVRLWGFHDKKPHEPTAAELASVRPLVGYRNVILDGERRTVRFAHPGMEIDLGGIAKGFAVELAANVLRRHGLDGFIDAGGNQYLLGLPPGKTSWTVGITNPDAPSMLLGVVETGETSVSTSADYGNFLTINGHTYGHILDPHTLAPSSAALSVTILSRDGTVADAMSKAAFILGPTAGLALIEATSGTAGVIAYRKPDGRIGVAMSPSLAPHFRPGPG